MNPQLSGLRCTLSIHDKSPATSGSASHLALNTCTARAKSHSLTSCTSTQPFKMLIAAFSLHPSFPSWSGSLHSEAAVFSLRQSKDIYLVSAPSMWTVTCCSPRACPQSCSCSKASNSSTASVTAMLRCPSHLISCAVCAHDLLNPHLS